MSEKYDKEKYIKNKISEFYKNRARKKYKEKYKKKAAQYYKKKVIVKNTINKYNKYKKQDVIYRIRDNLVRRAINELKKENIVLTISHTELLGCDMKILKKHLEDNFTFNMSFDNYGMWQIDHIYPISVCNLTDDIQLKKCFNYKNLQPLWKHENRSKSNKISLEDKDHFNNIIIT